MHERPKRIIVTYRANHRTAEVQEINHPRTPYRIVSRIAGRILPPTYAETEEDARVQAMRYVDKPS